MPQLMPLVWLLSTLMSFLLLFMLVEMYYCNETLMKIMGWEKSMFFMFYMW